MSSILSSEMSYEESMNHVLKELSKVTHPDRIYILETDRVTFSNTFEWCDPGVSSETDALQDLGYEEFLKGWESFTQNGTTVIMPDTRALEERDPACYEILRRQGIERLIAAPFFQNGQLIGYLCVGNYEENDAINTQRLLEMVSFFIGAKVLNQRLLKKLDHLSHYDTLTGVKNRNARIGFCKRGEAIGRSIGVIYADVDGLKQINDQRGHGAGDDVICRVARIMAGGPRPGPCASRGRGRIPRASPGHRARGVYGDGKAAYGPLCRTARLRHRHRMRLGCRRNQHPGGHPARG